MNKVKIPINANYDKPVPKSERVRIFPRIDVSQLKSLSCFKIYENRNNFGVNKTSIAKLIVYYSSY